MARRKFAHSVTQVTAALAASAGNVGELVEATRESLMQCAEKYIGMVLECYANALLDAAHQTVDSAIQDVAGRFFIKRGGADGLSREDRPHQ